MHIYLFILFILFSTNVNSDNLVILDMSGSMSDGEKNNVSRRMAKEELLKLSKISSTAIYSFGGDCNSLKSQSDFTQDIKILHKNLQNIPQPDGITPLAWSIQKGLQELKSHSPPNHLIIITDGVDSCGQDPCAYTKNSSPDNVKIYTVGLGMKKNSNEFKVLECISSEGASGGTAIAVDSNNINTGLEIAMKSISNNIISKTGDLLIKLLNSKGRYSKVGYSLKSLTDGRIYKGKTGVKITLPIGDYNIIGLNGKKSVHIDDSYKVLEFNSPSGHLKISTTCSGDNLSFSISNKQGDLITTASNKTGVDLLEGSYVVSINKYPFLNTRNIDIVSSEQKFLNMGDFGNMTVNIEDIDGVKIVKSLDYFNDNDSKGSGSKSILSGESGTKVILPVGIYNAHVSDTNSSLKGGENITVNKCEDNIRTIKQESVFYVCDDNDVTITNDTTGESTIGKGNTLIEVDINTYYNIHTSNGKDFYNIFSKKGRNLVNCDK